MEKLSIALNEDKAVFTPGETVAGAIRWNLDANPKRFELSLFWYTTGKGTQDVGVVETRTYDNPGPFGSKDFVFALPAGPYSFSGRLISLIWALELTCTPGSDTVRREITVSPTGREIVLGSVSAQHRSPWDEDNSGRSPLERMTGGGR